MIFLRSIICVSSIVCWSCNFSSSNNSIDYKIFNDIQEIDSTLKLGQNEDISTFDLEYIMGKFDPKTHSDFKEIPAKYRDNTIRYIRHEVLNAFELLYEAAKKDGIQLKIISATRNFEDQKRIWENKWTGSTKIENGKDASKTYPNPKDRAAAILKYSSMPGTSRHHWGTDMDFNALNNPYFEQGEGLKTYQWLAKRAQEFGFCQPYTPFNEERMSGYQEEKWHWTYVPTASKIHKTANKLLTNAAILGFLGSEVAVELDVVHHYVHGIHPKCIAE